MCASAEKGTRRSLRTLNMMHLLDARRLTLLWAIEDDGTVAPGGR